MQTRSTFELRSKAEQEETLERETGLKKGGWAIVFKQETSEYSYHIRTDSFVNQQQS